MTNITINIHTDEKSAQDGAEPASAKLLAETHLQLAKKHQDLLERHQELTDQMGDEIKPFMGAKLGGYMSHFLISLRFLHGSFKDRVISITSPMAAQTVAWGDPFIYEGPDKAHQVELPLPSGSSLPRIIKESDFINRPSEYFVPGKEVVWLQILNLDAEMSTELGPMRVILGETLLKKYPDIFRPSLGVAQALGKRGFPAKLFFNPYAIMETPVGAFRAIHGTLSYGRVTNFPPLHTAVTISESIPIEPVEAVRANMAAGRLLHETVQPIGHIIALSHPIDMEIHLPGDEAYQTVERLIAQQPPAGSI